MYPSFLYFHQVLSLFPSSQGLEMTWSSVVKIGQSLYREGPGKDPFRPDQRTPVKNFFLAGSYTKQVTTHNIRIFLIDRNQIHVIVSKILMVNIHD